MQFTDSHGNVIDKPNDEPVSWRVAVYGVVTHDDKVFMVQSGDGRWQFPGGGVEVDETLADALVREYAEETGYTIAVGISRPLYVREQPFYHSRSKRFYHSLQIFFSATLRDKVPDEHMMTEHDRQRERKWVDIRELSIASAHHTIHELVQMMKEASESHS